MTSPYTLLYKTPPHLKNLKTFGTAVFPWLRPYNAHKLQPTSVCCIFSGIFKGYMSVICFHPQIRKCIISRHVIHDDTVFPFKHSKLCSQSLQNQIDTSSVSSIVVPILVPMTTTSGVSGIAQRYESGSVSSSVMSESSASSMKGSHNTVLPNATTQETVLQDSCSQHTVQGFMNS